MAEQRGRASGDLSTDDAATPGPPPLLAAEDVKGHLAGRFQAVINIHDCNLRQIEVAIQNNAHEVDPHPAQEGQWLERHPIYLVAFDYSKLDDEGNPTEGKPSELNLKMIREIFSTRFKHVSSEAPPSDGSHIAVDGMHFIAETDRHGNATGRVRLGNPSEVAR